MALKSRHNTINTISEAYIQTGIISFANNFVITVTMSSSSANSSGFVRVRSFLVLNVRKGDVFEVIDIEVVQLHFFVRLALFCLQNFLDGLLHKRHHSCVVKIVLMFVIVVTVVAIVSVGVFTRILVALFRLRGRVCTLPA